MALTSIGSLWLPDWDFTPHIAGVPAFDRRWDVIVHDGRVRVVVGP